MQRVFFTSDTHLGHANIIKYSNRPFSNVKEMDDALIDNINSMVHTNDILYHLGDFTFKRDYRDISDYRERIKCKNIYFIYGNHDHEIKKSRDLQLMFISCRNFAEIRDRGQDITLCHYALRVWNKSHHGTWHLYGHSHGSLPDDPNSLSFDCGVDCHNYKPIYFEQIEAIMSKKEFKPIDHHGRRDFETKSTRTN